MDTLIQDYLDRIPEARRKKVNKLHSLILKCFPKATVDMQYKMPTYRYGEGWVAIANQKNYVSLYTCSAQHLEEFRRTHPGIKTGKGCINFRMKDEIPEAAVQKVVEHAMLHPKGEQH
ncbi:MAG: DUF1801 domain-containing protein [Candidatus Thiodiazotropha sp. (ex Codakia rugifera)]|nr:DUF1801 domain-containing protein [Candidatus Thiodiazotropha sp. (ex Codakia rugifera)]